MDKSTFLTNSLLGVLLLFPAWLAPAAAERVYTFAIVPQYPKIVIHRDWQPFLDYLAKKTGVRFKMLHYPNIPSFAAAVRKGKPDFAFMSAYQLIRGRKARGYIPLVKDRNQNFRGVLVVRKDSPLKSLRDLNGKEIAFPAPNAFGASLYMRSLLHRHRIRFRPHFVQTHANVYRNVIFGNVDVGGGVTRTLDKESQNVRNHLRILYATPPIPSHPICAHPRVPGKLRQRVIKAVLLAKKENRNVMLRAAQFPHPVMADYKKHYSHLAGLGLEKYIIHTSR